MTTPHYDFHVFICQNQRPEGATRGCCMSKNSGKLLEYMQTTIKNLGIKNIRINKSGCLNECERGVSMVIYPDATWYSIKTEEDIDKIVQTHILNKGRVDDLLMK